MKTMIDPLRKTGRGTTRLCLIVLLAAFPLFGQEGAMDGNEPKPEEEVFELSPFEVQTDRDVGWVAAAQISMTSMNELIRDTPANISVVTTEMIEDLQASDLKEALDYESGIFMETFENQTSVNEAFSSGETSPSSNVEVGDPFANAITIRGYPVPNQQRHGFRVGAILPKYGVNLGGLTDSVNTDRLEAVRGPQSLLYGINVLSGIVNIVPKSPMPRKSTSFSLSIGSDDYRRATLDHTGPILEDGSLNYRIMGAYTEEGDWTEHLLDRIKYAAVQLEWRPFERATLLLEWQEGQYHRTGGGPQFFQSAASAFPLGFDNAYDEKYSFGYDYENDLYINYALSNPPADAVETETGLTVNVPLEGRHALIQDPDRTYNFTPLNRGSRISGPDPYFERDETNLLLLYRHEVLDNLHLELGGYYTETESEQFGVNLHTFVNSTAHSGPARLAKSVIGVEGNPGNAPYIDPEIVPDDPYGFGIGETFIYVDNVDRNFHEEIHYASYWWYKVPTSAETLQLRARITYAFDTNFLDNRIRIRHRFLLGSNFTRDIVQFARTDSLSDSRYANWLGLTDMDTGLYSKSRTDQDPFVYRSSIFDTSTIRYNGEALVTPGSFGWKTKYPNLEYLRTSGHIEATQWFRGAYAIYHGKLWEDRLTIVAGLRHDAYQVKEREELYIRDNALETDEWLYHAGESRVTPYSVGYGDTEYSEERWHDVFSNDFNTRVRDDVNAFMEAFPNGTTEYNFPKTLTYNTGLASFSLRVTDDISVFYLYSEGIFPNTGQRDALNDPIPAEQTENNEIGIKVELFNSRVIGTLSAYKIKRRNATWYWPYAPNPSKWYPGPNSNITEEFNAFSAEAVINPDLDGKGEPTQFPRLYAVQGLFVEKALEEAGMGNLYSYGSAFLNQRELDKLDTELGFIKGGRALLTESSGDPRKGFEEYQFVVIDYDKMMEAHQKMEGGNPLVAAMDMAQQNTLDILGRTMWWGNSGPQGGAKIHAASANNATGATVPFDEEGTGFDLDFIISPFQDDRYQIKLTFSEQNREVIGQGFHLPDGYAIDSFGELIVDANGQPYLMTTEYDRWATMLGRENFEDPRNPSTLKPGSSISGLNLSFVPKHSWRILNKYKFQEGWLEGVAVALGLRYNSAIPTTIPIGGENISENRFPTPDIPERYVWDASVSYSWQMWNGSWRISLRVENLADDWVSEAISTFDDPTFAEPVVRRSLVYYEPRSYRLTISASF